MKAYAVEIEGTKDVIQCKFTAEVPGVKKKGPRLDEWRESCHYHNGAIGFPAINIEQGLARIASSQRMKIGKLSVNNLIQSGLFVEPDFIPFVGISGTLDQIEKHKQIVIRVDPVRIPPRTGAMVEKRRLSIKAGWRLRFNITVHHDELTEDVLRHLLAQAGRYNGLGSWRPRFGTFTLTNIKEIKSEAA